MMATPTSLNVLPDKCFTKNKQEQKQDPLPNTLNTNVIKYKKSTETLDQKDKNANPEKKKKGNCIVF